MARVLDRVVSERGDIFVIHGGASGADKLAGEWAASRGLPCAEVEALWDYFGNPAGPIRNSWMLLLKPDGVVAFKDGSGHGTADMISKANRANVPVMEIG